MDNVQKGTNGKIGGSKKVKRQKLYEKGKKWYKHCTKK